MNNKIITIDNLGSNEKLNISKINKYSKTISYVRVGDGKGSRYFDKERKRFNMEKVIYKDAVVELINMNEAEGFLFKMLIDKATKFNIDRGEYEASAIVKIDIKELSNSEKNKISRGYKSLREKNIVKRIKRGGSYCINPTMIVVDKFNEEYNYYLSLK